MPEEPFRLQNDPPPHRPWRGQKSSEKPKDKQAMLFSGLDCVPGQQDLFSTDGAASEEEGT